MSKFVSTTPSGLATLDRGTTPAAPTKRKPVESDKFLMRRMRIKELEREQMLEDEAAVQIIQSLSLSSIMPLDSVKTEFQDLDGLKRPKSSQYDLLYNELGQRRPVDGLPPHSQVISKDVAANYVQTPSTPIRTSYMPPPGLNHRVPSIRSQGDRIAAVPAFTLSDALLAVAKKQYMVNRRSVSSPSMAYPKRRKRVHFYHPYGDY